MREPAVRGIWKEARPGCVARSRPTRDGRLTRTGSVAIEINGAPAVRRYAHMAWNKPEFEIVELGMEVGAYAGNA